MALVSGSLEESQKKKCGEKVSCGNGRVAASRPFDFRAGTHVGEVTASGLGCSLQRDGNDGEKVAEEAVRGGQRHGPGSGSDRAVVGCGAGGTGDPIRLGGEGGMRTQATCQRMYGRATSSTERTDLISFLCVPVVGAMSSRVVRRLRRLQMRVIQYEPDSSRLVSRRPDSPGGKGLGRWRREGEVSCRSAVVQ